MNANKKAFLVVLVGLLLIIAGIVWLTYHQLKGDPVQEEAVILAAEEYVKEHFDEPMEVVGSLYDNADLYDEFQYAAKVEPADDPQFQFLVFYHKESDSYQDSYVAEVWEDQLEKDLKPYLEEQFGEVLSLWIYYPKDIGYQLDIALDNIPHYSGQEGYPVVQISLNRKRENKDEQKVNELIDFMKNKLGVKHGNISVDFASGWIKSRGILKEF